MKITLVRLFAALLGVLALDQACHAFYFPGWPGDGLPRVQRLAPPKVPPLQPSIVPLEGTLPPSMMPPSGTPLIVEPQAVPEPGTLAMALMGASLIGGGLAWRCR